MKKDSYNEQDILAGTKGELFGKDSPKLPADNMLMVNRIDKITTDNGEFNKGYIEASLDINPNLWFFNCHFIDDPVMPGCLGLDSLWQLVGFYLAWLGFKGKGRALGVGEVKFKGEILPTAKLVKYYIDIKKIMNQKLVMGIANGKIQVDGKLIYFAKNLKVGFFN